MIDHEDLGGGTAAYLVRLKGDQEEPREFVGLFVAHGIAELIDFVDECCPVDCCEYAILPNGGVYQPGRSFPVPLPGPLIEVDADLFHDASICENWVPYFLGDGSHVRWRPLAAGGAAND